VSAFQLSRYARFVVESISSRLGGTNVSSIVVEGRLVTPTQIELSEPVEVGNPAVEVEIRSRAPRQQHTLLEHLQRLASRPARGRSYEDIMRQVAEERSSWESER
jgi:hypothetical protein